MNSGLGYASARSRSIIFGSRPTWRSEIKSRRSAPSRIAGDIGVFWRRPPSVKDLSPVLTAGNSSGVAADARAWRGPLRAALWRTNGSGLPPGRARPALGGETAVGPRAPVGRHPLDA